MCVFLLSEIKFALSSWWRKSNLKETNDWSKLLKKPQACPWCRENCSHYLFEDSGVEEDSNMASPVFPIGWEGLCAHTHTNVSDPHYQQFKHRVSITTLNHLQTKALLSENTHSHTHTLSRALECIHATVNCTGLSKHRQAKDHQREKMKEEEDKKRKEQNEKRQTFTKTKFEKGIKSDAASLETYSHLCKVQSLCGWLNMCLMAAGL